MTDLAFPDLAPDESQLRGQRTDAAAALTAGRDDERIFWLVTQRLTPAGRTVDGWDALFIDPRDGRYWELTFPQGSLFGGGPRQLTVLAREHAAEKYGTMTND